MAGPVVLMVGEAFRLATLPSTGTERAVDKTDTIIKSDQRELHRAHDAYSAYSTYATNLEPVAQ
ncbi:hypothetical protein [Orrella marina]|uniref:hypothetical protein n=1 Tax=Orrella marina TaxID=2163011 RepID=UPI001D13099A|nr:hypothetical protein [Orrella marina]